MRTAMGAGGVRNSVVLLTAYLQWELVIGIVLYRQCILAMELVNRNSVVLSMCT